MVIMAVPSSSDWHKRDPNSIAKLWVQCKPFECPAGQRAIQKKNFRVYGYNFCVDTTNITESVNVDFDPDVVMDFRKQLIPCCYHRDICLRMCGMSLEKCHNDYHYCMDKVCKIGRSENEHGRHPECNQVGYTNSFHSDITFPLDVDGLRCSNFTNAQIEACECVDDTRLTAEVKQRVIDFYKKYNPKKLNKKQTELKDKNLLKDWKGKRAEMFYNMWLTYKHEIGLRDRWSHKFIKMVKKNRTKANETIDASYDSAGTLRNNAAKGAEEEYEKVEL